MKDEFRLIDKISKFVEKDIKRPVIDGIGDDCAVLKYDRTRYLLVTIDTFNEGIHFSRKYSSFYEAGFKAATGGISDICAMGGRCHAVFVSISVPKGVSEKQVMDFYRGVRAVCRYAGASVAGGDTTASRGSFSATIAATGLAMKKDLARRRGALPGDGVYITGPVGFSSAGLALLEKGVRLSSSLMRKAVRKHRTPLPCVNKLRGRITSMIDVSDGLSSELNHLAGASRVKIIIDRRAILSFKGLREIARVLKKDPLELAFGSGEEYELLFTARQGNAIPIGHVSRGSGVYLDDGQRIIPSGYNHFKT